MEEDLLEKTLRLAGESCEPASKICSAAGVTTRWYYMLLAGEIIDPGVRRVQRLHDHLAATALSKKRNDQEAA